MRVDELKNKILQLAIQGKLVPQDPNDEPASVLLERIKKEKEQLIKEKKIKKEKPLPEISEEEKAFEIPEGWKWCRLGEIGDWGAGATPSRSNLSYYNGDICWIKTGELNDDYINGSEEKITNIALKECSLRLNKIGDVLIAMYGATIGKLGILNIEATTNQACCACTPFEQVNNKYLYTVLLAIRQKFRSESFGGAQPNISKQKIINSIMPLPPFQEQKRIVAKVDELFSIIDKLSENKESLSKNIDITRDKVLQLAIQGKLVPQDLDDEPASVLLEKIKKEKEQLIKEKKIKKEKPLPEISEEEKSFEIPEGWEWCRLQDVFTTIRNGANIKQCKSDKGIPITRIETIAEGKINRDKVGYANIFEIGKYESYVLKDGDILMSHINSEKHLGKTALYKKEKDETIIHGMNLLCLRSNNKIIDYKYAYYYLNTINFKSSILDIVKRAVNQASINITNLKIKILPIPPLEEQKRIVAKVDEIIGYLDKLQDLIDGKSLGIEGVQAKEIALSKAEELVQK